MVIGTGRTETETLSEPVGVRTDYFSLLENDPYAGQTFFTLFLIFLLVCPVPHSYSTLFATLGLTLLP
jgi:hypothetical protein